MAGTPARGSLDAPAAGAERTVASTVTVPASPEAVWALLTDPDRFAEFAENTLEVTRADRPLNIGSTYEERNRVFGPITGRSRWTVTQHEEPHRGTHAGEGIPLAAKLDFFFELVPAGDGTRVTVGLRYSPGLGPLGKLADRLFLHRSLQSGFERTAANIARIVAAEPVSTAAAPAPAS